MTPTTAPQDARTDELLEHLREDTIPAAVDGTDVEASVTGSTALTADVSSRLQQRMPWFLGAVIGLSFLVLMIVFRSVLVPLKAAALNVLGVAAAYGVIVAVFQWGWGASLIGVHETVPIMPLAPMLMFAILFGLSMDYEVFLMSRVREQYRKHFDPRRAVVEGVGSTARVITSAALIMISVFASFILDVDVTTKMFGIGLAVAVFLDVTLVRMVLVPAAMSLLGHRAWWLPAWLERRLPTIDIEGGAHDGEEQQPSQPAAEPERELVAGLIDALNQRTAAAGPLRGRPQRRPWTTSVDRMALRVVLADDNYLVREGITALLAEVEEIELVESVGDPQSLLKSVREHQPDAVLTDIRMPPTHTTEGIDAAKQIRAEHPSIGVVVLSQYVEEDYALALLSDGVAGLGYLLKERVSDIDRAGPGPQRRGSRRLRTRPQGRRGPDDAQGGRGELAAARADREGARGPGADGDRAHQREHRADAVHERAVGREAHQRRLPQARAGRRGREQPPRDGGPRLRRGDPLTGLTVRSAVDRTRWSARLPARRPAGADC